MEPRLGRNRGLSASLCKMADAVERRNKGLQPPVGNKRMSTLGQSFRSRNLMRMLGKRSTVEVLEAKGIYIPAAVFGCPLEKQNLDQCRTLSGKTIDVPRIIWKTVAKLESKKELLET